MARIRVDHILGTLPDSVWAVGRVGVLAAVLGIGGVLGSPVMAAADPDGTAPGTTSTAPSNDPSTTRGGATVSRHPSARAAQPTTRVSGARVAREPVGAQDRTAVPAPNLRNDSAAPTAPSANSVSAPIFSTPAVVAPTAVTPQFVVLPPRQSGVVAAAGAAAFTPATPAIQAVAAGRGLAPAAPPPAAAASARISAMRHLIDALSPLLGSGTGNPVESPLSWAVLALSRRQPAGLTSAGLATTAAPLSAATTSTSTTTKITWSWGTNTAIAFNPAADKLDFGWMGAPSFDVTEQAGSTQIAIVGNSQTYTLTNVPVRQLQMSNIIAQDPGAQTKWQNLITAAGQATVTPPSVSVANATVAEGNSGTTNLAFTVTLSKASASTVSVNYATANATATAGQDYTATSGTITFAPGVLSQQVKVAVTADTTVEPDETLTVTLSAPTNATLATATATGTITNDDTATVVTAPTISVANATVAEGNSGSTNLAFTVTLSKASTSTVSVNYATANGTATAGADFTATSGTITFAPGVLSQQVKVAVTGDTTVEPTETLTVTLSAPTGATLGTATATGTITNDDTAVVPGDRWGTSFFAPYVDMAGWPVPNLLTISQSTGATLLTAAFLQATPEGTLGWAGLSTLTPGGTSDQAKAIDAAIKTFKAAGGDVMISLGGAAGTSLAQSYAARGYTAQALADAYARVIDTYGVNHIDFDIEGAAVADAPSIALNSQALKLLQQSKPDVKVWYTLPVLPTGLTADGINVVESALKAGVNLSGINVMAMDFGESAAPTSGASAQTMGTYAIRSAEGTYAQLSPLYGKYAKTFGYSQLGVTPMIGVNDVTSEVFTVTDAQALENYARVKGLGMLGFWSVTRDTPGTLGQATPTTSGVSSPAGSFSKIFNDYGTVNLVNYGTTTGGGTTTPVQGGTTTVISWQWGTNTVLAFDTAKDKLDFGWFQPGNFDISETSGSTRITIVGNNQTYTLNGVPLGSMSTGNIVALDSGTLTKWQNAIAAAGQTTTVVTPPSVSVANATVAEGNSGTTNLAFTVTLSKASASTVSVNYATANATATAGQDYTATSGTITFAPGVLSQQVKVAVTADTTVEPDETLTVTLSAPTNATLATATATGTITNDDTATVVTAPTISVANATVAEGNSGSTNLAFTVTLSKASTSTVSVNYATANGTATAGADFTATSGTITFAPGVLSQQVKVAVTGDTTVEPTETLTVTLSAPTGATLGTATATGTITNDDTSTVPLPATALAIATTDKVVAAYFPEWGIYGRNFQVADIPGDQVNRVIYSFLNLTSTGEVAIYDSFAATDKRFAANETVNGEADQWYYPASDPRSTQTVWGNFNQLAELKAKYPHMRVSIAIGGWTLSSNFSSVASTAAGRETMANSIVKFLSTYQMFDGIDFDWEYPGGGGLAGNSQSSGDGANYAELLKVVRAKLDALGQQTGRKYDISVASPAGYDKIANFNLAGLAPSVDFFNVMAYDFHGTWETTTGHQSAITGDPNGYDVKTAVGLYLAAGVAPGKVVLGAPLYTRAWSGVADGGDGGYLEKTTGTAPGTFEAGVYDYKDLLAQLKDPASGWKLYWDDTAQAAYLYNAAKGLFSSFETPTSIAQKAQWADDLGLGGMMFWDITNDAVGSPESLVRAAYSSLVLGSDLSAIRGNSTLREVIIGGDGVITPLPNSTTL